MPESKSPEKSNMASDLRERGFTRLADKLEEKAAKRAEAKKAAEDEAKKGQKKT